MLCQPLGFYPRPPLSEFGFWVVNFKFLLLKSRKNSAIPGIEERLTPCPFTSPTSLNYCINPFRENNLGLKKQKTFLHWTPPPHPTSCPPGKVKQNTQYTVKKVMAVKILLQITLLYWVKGNRNNIALLAWGLQHTINTGKYVRRVYIYFSKAVWLWREWVHFLQVYKKERVNIVSEAATLIKDSN